VVALVPTHGADRAAPVLSTRAELTGATRIGDRIDASSRQWLLRATPKIAGVAELWVP